MANMPDYSSLSTVPMFYPLKEMSLQESGKSQSDDSFSSIFDSDNREANQRSKDGSDQDSLNSIPRESIAVGATHLAARESIVWLEMNKRRNEYTDTAIFRIFTGTWNVNGQSPPASLSDWLSFDQEAPDIYAIGFQELDLSKEAYVFYDSPREFEWLQVVEQCLHPRVRYFKVKLVRLVGIMLIVFAQEKHKKNISNVVSCTVGTGIMGKLGNKGGVSIRMDFHNTSICFVNSHLAAHPDECERRNQDYRDICSRTNFQVSNFQPKAIKDHDQIYWIGDLNYRIDMDNSSIKQALNEKSYLLVIGNDQLNQQKIKNAAFSGYVEGQIEFPPTYKFNLNSDEYDNFRSPAWCDRILWRGININQVGYRSHHSLKISDHKPVSAIFTSGIMVVKVTKQKEVYEEVMKQLDKLENEFLPQVTVDNMEVNFNVVRFNEPQTKYLTIANTGQVPVTFEFIRKPNEKYYCKEWLSIKPHFSYIMPGEKCDVELEVNVDKRTVHPLNSQLDKINDILVLHLQGGKDFFITISGVYQPTCFGMSLESLIYIRQPISELDPKKIASLETNPETRSGIEPYDIPKEIWLLIDHLSKHGLEQDQLFEQPGLPSEIWQIRDCLDTCMPSTIPGSINSVAEALLLFLEALPEPVIPYKVYNKSLEASQNFYLCQQIVSQLPPVHQNVFKYIMAFLRALLSYTGCNKLDAKTLSTLFGGVLLRPPLDENEPPNSKKNSAGSERKKGNFIYHFLNNEPF